MEEELPVSMPLRTAGLAGRKPVRSDLQPDAAQCRALALLLGVSGVAGLRFRGELRPAGRADLELEARLQARVIQPCVVSLAPVTTEIDEAVRRRYLRDYVAPSEEETELPEDDSEPLPGVVDPGAVMTEALALALPDYPRAPGAALDPVAVAPPGVEPLRDQDLKPFAGLAGLARRLSGDDPESGTGGKS